MSPIKRAVGLSAILLLSLGVAAPARADQIITTSGTQFSGKVTEEGDRYRLIDAKGGVMTFPKSMVKEVIRQDATAEPAPPVTGTVVGPKVQALLKPLRDSVISARAAVSKATQDVKEKQRKEIADAVANDPEVKTARLNYERILRVAARLGKPVGDVPPAPPYEVGINPATTIYRPDGTPLKTYAPNANTIDGVLAETKNLLAAAQAQVKDKVAKQRLPEQQKELAKYTALSAPLAKADEILQAASATLGPIADDPAKVKAALAECETQVRQQLDIVSKGLADLTGQPIPAPGAAPPAKGP